MPGPLLNPTPEGWRVQIWNRCDGVHLARGAVLSVQPRARCLRKAPMTKNIGMLLLAIYLILVGITALFHIAMGAVVMGVLALVTGILILVGK
jgi:hypothetical protein